MDSLGNYIGCIWQDQWGEGRYMDFKKGELTRINFDTDSLIIKFLILIILYVLLNIFLQDSFHIYYL